MTEKQTNLADSELHLLFGQLADEFTERLRSGHSPDIETYAQRHPDHADAIRRALAGLAALGSPTHDEPLDPLDIATPCERVLGDFRILREIGRGGMGVVYEANQISLDRKVALKVLPFAALLDQHHVQRFKNEARAAAALDHPNIVPIHGVGSDRGVHFYAMKFVDGHSLAEILAHPSHVETQDAVLAPRNGAADDDTQRELQCVIETLGSDSPRRDYRSIAELGVQAADALHHAHVRGIVHRDVKPSNLILDYSGKLWVADFGLASVQGNHDLTLTGDLLGTLRYMSPEQAAGDRLFCDHRTDIYSLGITLYELLTGRPAFAEVHRERLLKSVLDSDPPSPRTIDDQIPADLNVIVQKAIDKDPAARYSSAEEMAADLRRFLDHRPIKARRPNLLQKLNKWTRRNRAATRSLVFAGLAAIACLSVVTVNTRRALVRQEQLRKQAEASAQRSDQSLELAHRAVEKFLTEAGGKLVWKPHVDPVGKYLYLQAADLLEQLSAQPGVDNDLRLALAKAYAMAGFVHQFSDTREESLDAYQKAEEILLQLHHADPRPLYALELSHVYLESSIRLQTMNNRPAAYEALLNNQKVLEQFALADFPSELRADYLACSASFHSNLGSVYHSIDKLSLAEQHYEESDNFWEEFFALDPSGIVTRNRDLPDLRWQQNVTFTYWSNALKQLNRYSEAFEKRQLIEETATKIEGLADDSNVFARFSNVAGQADLLMCVGKFNEAKSLLQRSLDPILAARNSLPDISWSASRLHSIYLGLCKAHIGLGELPDAEENARLALSVVEESYETISPDTHYYARAGAVHVLLADVFLEQDRQDEAAEQYRDAARLLSERKISLLNGKLVATPSYVTLLALCPDESIANRELAVQLGRESTRDREVTTWYRAEAIAELQAGNFQEAIDAAKKSCDARQGGDAIDWLVLALAHAKSGELETALTYYEKIPAAASADNPIMLDFINELQYRRLYLRATQSLKRGEDEPSNST